MKQSTITYVFVSVACILMVALTFSAVTCVRANWEVEEVSARKDASLGASHIIGASSKGLTDSVQSFVITGDKKWLDKYWEEVNFNKSQAKAIAELKKMNTPKSELDMVALASANSKKLVETETRAMRLVLEAQGVPVGEMPESIAAWNLSPADLALNPVEKMELAKQLIFGDDYRAEVVKIMTPIHKFQLAISERLQTEVAENIARSQLYMWVLIGSGIALVLALVSVLWVFHKNNGKILHRYAKQLHDRENCDLKFQLQPAGLAEVRKLAEEFNNQIAQTASVIKDISHRAADLGKAAGELAESTATMESATKTVAEEAAVASQGVDEVRSHIHTVATSTQEMEISIREISTSATSASLVAQEAVTAAESTQVIVDKLSDSSQLIGEVLNTITSIAAQTNLLALNATIEAARAGEAGRGFAVVAGEVKELATQTAEATEDISARVSSIQDDAHETSVALQNIAQIIDRINETQATIASAVEEQTATTNEITTAVQQTASSASDIAGRTQHTATVSQQASDEVSRAAQSLEKVQETAEKLVEIVKQYQ